MSERGLMGVALLWLLVAVSAVALSVLSIGKWYQAQGRNQVTDVKMLSMAQMASLLEREMKFDSAVREHKFLSGRVLIERTFGDSKKEVRLLCRVYAGKTEKQVEVGWTRVGDDWRVHHWREM